MEDLQARFEALLAPREAPSPSPSEPGDVVRAAQLAESWSGYAEVWQVLKAAEDAMENDAGVVRQALVRWVTQFPRDGLCLPPLAAREPGKVVPSVNPSTAEAAQQAAFEANPELRLAWWREDPGLNQLFELWQVVNGPGAAGDAKDRQGELFLYMHRQLLARYETERKALRVDPVQSWWPFTVASDPWGYGARGPNQKWPDAPEMSAERQRLWDAIETGKFADVDSLGTALQTWAEDGQRLFAGMEPGMGDPASAARDPLSWRWRKAVDDLFATWQSYQSPHTFFDAPSVAIRKGIAEPFAPAGSANIPNRSPDIILSRITQIPEDWRPHLPEFGQAVFGGEHWDEEFASTSYTTGELQTTMTDGRLDHADFVSYLRVDNHGIEPAGITVRIFLAAQELAEERRMWMELDKFRAVLKRGERAVICRPARLSSVIAKPDGQPSAGATDYCGCGLPANLLLPRGRTDGMKFRLLVMLTDWNVDKVPADSPCGSFSLCGGRGAYPDARPMGYPFDRPLPDDKTVSQLVAAQPNMATRDITIRWIPSS